MNCDTGEIKTLDQIAAIEKIPIKDFGGALPSPWVSVRDDDLTKLKRMSKDRRKNWMRNKPCVCGSGVKFKKCCWHKYTS